MASKSLRYRLSLGIALHSFVVLVLVCAAIYFWVSTGFRDQQTNVLSRQRVLVEHLFSEMVNDRNDQVLTHKLSDVLVGQTAIAVEISRDDGTIFFERPVPLPGPVRVSETDLAAMDGTDSTWKLRLRLDTSSDEATLSILAASLLVAALVGASLIAAGGAVLVGRGLKPVSRLVEQCGDISSRLKGDLLDGSAQPSELEPLVREFNSLLSQLRATFIHLEAFNADVAHELATPLSTLISSVEITLRRPRKADELEDVLSCNLEELHRLSGIVQDMLFLAHADRGSRARRADVKSLAQIVSRVFAVHAEAMEARGLAGIAQGDASLDADGALVERALSNLVSNAVHHATDGSSIVVSILIDSEEVRVQVENDGDTIPSEHLDRIFERFYRAEAARSGGGRRHGLGLSIVAAIAQMHGGSTFARSRDRRTAVGFTLHRRGGPQQALGASAWAQVTQTPQGV